MVAVVDSGEIGALVLLDMSSAFDTVDSEIMSDVLHRRFDIQDSALNWFKSYFMDRTNVVAVGDETSKVRNLKIGVPQGAVLGPRSFITYAEDVTEVFDEHETTHQLFADDMQAMDHDKPCNAIKVVRRLEKCIMAVKYWCCSKRLQLNEKKTEFMWFGSSTGIRKLEMIPALDRQLHIGSDNISSVDVIRDLGFYFDSELNMKAHISRTSRACFFHLRRLRAIRNRLGQEVTARLVSAFVLSRLDYCNALLAGFQCQRWHHCRKS
jgi:hypothetical protein